MKDETLVESSMGNIQGVDLDAEMDETLDAELNEGIEALPELHDEDDILFVPEQAKEFYKNKGFTLHWVRIFVPGTSDYDKAHIQKQEQRGYTFLKREEIPGLNSQMTSMLGEAVKDSFGLYVVGENALCKIPEQLVKNRAAKKYKKIRERSQAVINDLRKNNVMPSEMHGEKYEITRSAPRQERRVSFNESES